jgi:CDP-glycerol glycerophosphotransferase (TagB/SpsB family)/glycosyltransferase involved in cell wall biosynthesis
VRILVHTSVIDEKLGGATLSTLDVASRLGRRGHAVAAIASTVERPEVFGVPCYKARTRKRCHSFYEWADVVFAMRRPPLQPMKEYRQWNEVHGASPTVFVYFAHNVGQPWRYGYQPADLDLVVFNAIWTEKETHWPGPSTVLHPPISPSQYEVTPGSLVTQVNLAEKKGGSLFWEIASRLPDANFLAVTGREHDQVIPRRVPANVEVMDYTDDIRAVYERTRVLLMPSQGLEPEYRWTDEAWTESYGRVGVEAAVSGIPVISLPTPGIQEALGEGAIYCEKAVDSWVGAVRTLENPDAYAVASGRARAAVQRLDPDGDVLELESLLRGLVEDRATTPLRDSVFPARPTQPMDLPRRPALTPRRMSVDKELRKYGRRVLEVVGVADRRVRRVLSMLVELLRFSADVGSWVLGTFEGRRSPRDPRQVAVMAPSSGRFADNAKYAYLRLELERDLSVTYVTNSRIQAERLVEAGVRAASSATEEGRAAVKSASLLIGTALEPFRRELGHLGSGARKVQLWHGAGVKKVALGWDKHQNNLATRRGRLRAAVRRTYPRFDLTYFPSEAQRHERESSFRSRAVKVNGLVRNDALRGFDFGPLALVGTDTVTAAHVRHRREQGLRTILYAPTFRESGREVIGGRVPIDFTEVDELLRQREAILVLKFHPKMDERIDVGLFSNICEYDAGSDVYPHLDLFDALITDYSSIAADYALLGRPIAKYFPDRDRVVAEARLSEEALDLLPGDDVETFSEAVSCVLQQASSGPVEHPSTQSFVAEQPGWSGDVLVQDVRQLLAGRRPAQ